MFIPLKIIAYICSQILTYSPKIIRTFICEDSHNDSSKDSQPIFSSDSGCTLGNQIDQNILIPRIPTITNKLWMAVKPIC